MDRSRWETVITPFQARARGYLVRSELRRAREDFEEIVKEIDGGLTHLRWTETVISVPHFTDAGGSCLQPGSSAGKPSDPGLDVGARPERPAAPSSQERDRRVLPGKTEAERDDLPGSPFGGDGERQQGRSSAGNRDGGVMESTGESSTIWSSVELDTCCGHSDNGPQQHRLAQEVPRSPQALRLHRNTLTMELLWLQQAIDSRKKYLSLKDSLSVS
ncbi:IQ domain-containing protein C [Stegastes partitus]|uniref:IQ domain-containing protein C n=1 Tax=Stegastes partitus TaxID=144197 RepID=A0A9Y4N5D3_9TELE|nr:PREDICTED: IQ domain-containing protein C [Stegastes partitus]